MVRENKGQKETLSHIIIYKTRGKVKNGGGGNTLWWLTSWKNVEGDSADLWGLRAQNVPNRVADNGGEAGPITFDLLIQPLGIAKEIHLPIFLNYA